jgi:hypothetical protein
MDTQRSAPVVRVGDAEIDVTVDINIEEVEKDSSSTNDTEMDDAAREVIAQRRALRPKAIERGLPAGLPSVRDAGSQIKILSTRRRSFFF